MQKVKDIKLKYNNVVIYLRNNKLYEGDISQAGIYLDYYVTEKHTNDAAKFVLLEVDYV